MGTSAGSINAALWGAALHRGASAAAEEVVGVWEQMSDDDVFRPLLPFTALRSGLQYATGALLERGPGMTSLLDTTPLQRTADRSLRTEQLATNIADGVRSRIRRSATHDTTSTYSRSHSPCSCIGPSFRAEICHNPVRPGLT